MRVPLALWLAWLPACSTLPEPTRPAHLDHHVAADYVVPSNGRLVLPVSSPGLLVLEFTLQPPPQGEQFHDATRWFTFPPGTHVQVQGRFRTWAAPGARPASAPEVLLGAERVRPLDGP